MPENESEWQFWGDLWWWRIWLEMWASGREDLRGWWSDGIDPERYVLDADPPYIDGHVYLGTSVDVHWPFRAILTGQRSGLTTEEIAWDELLPPKEATGWLTIDPVAELVVIDLGVREPCEEEIIIRENHPSTPIPRGAPTPEADTLSGDIVRTDRRRVHSTIDPALGWQPQRG